MINVVVEISADRLVVACPYNEDFVTRAKNLGGKWNAGKKVWEFDPRFDSQVRDLLWDIYSLDGRPTPDADFCTLKLTIKKIARIAQRKIVLAGREILTLSVLGASAGEGVAFYAAGDVETKRNTVKNVYVVTLPKDSEIVITDFPRDALAEVETLNSEIFEVEVLNNDRMVGRETLEKERKALSARLAEIDRLLAACEPAVRQFAAID